MIKRLILAIIFLVVVVGGLIGFNLFRSKMIKDFFANMQQPAQTVSTVTVEPGVWQPGVEAIGTASALNGVDLTVQLDGVVQKINFKANQDVKQGDILLQMEDSIQRADLAAAEAEAVLAQQNLKRADTLRTRGVGAVSNVDTTASAANAAVALVEKMRATLAQKSVKAPFSGVIGIPKVDIGQYLTPGTVIATLQNTDIMRIDFTVPEQLLATIKLGQTVKVGSNADKLDFTGKIVGIDPKIDPTTRLVSVRAEVDNPDHKLTPGQFVQVRVELPEESNVIALPQTSIVSSLYGDYVYVVRPEQKQESAKASEAAKAQEGQKQVAQQVFIKLGRRSAGNVEVTSGLKPGDIIITAGQNRLSSGVPVKIDNTVNPSGNPADRQ
ncbi:MULTISPECIES: efflux RND transporter periplasmic adaptor subunit [unclassified Brucella]|uniref:efflux RND transporter periplasmic adaptor subunit n=1 Tax=unclassified Brucella TaxID=2632610 RepID=UPI0009728850|nr:MULTISPECIES: efflux RND transporter periplasmic adaptor subunit [unclassified Brucella]APX70849.1 efflux transporter periplasmic adaptor subunit [Brucella sp. 09RB8471]MRN43525.1 efflux RND transporter periplasmic adaptor subunit [Brucella sp. 09RB8913]MRN58918.1 efflux RND transporter periplasmic adaptor subunit [Brucella sp. 09RB8918]MRN79363.1 efflux RND transporter periplasmic adaptor subunit [Brucella sp. 10RB9210]QTN98772.1 efflux RND transporter periplasmic adaptor subunit [Brucella